MSDSENKEKEVVADVTDVANAINESKSSANKVTTSESDEEKITPWRCFTGSAISGVLGFAAYLLAKAIVITYTTMPINFNNPMAIRIASTVRTLVMGLTIMATFLFSMVTVGLIALGIKLILDENKAKQT